MQKMQDVQVRLTEAKPYTISYGFGYQTFDLLRGVFSISNRNLFGTARGLVLQVRGGAREGRALLTYSDPHLLFDKVNSTVSALAEKRVLRKTFAYREYSAIFEAEKKLSRERGELAVGEPTAPLKSLFLRYRFSDIDTTKTPKKLDPADRRFLAIHISSVAGGVVRDTRDNAIDPTHGNFLSTSLEWATSYLGSDTDFLKSFNEFQYYAPFHSIVFANALRLGLAKGFKETNNLPLSQAFFAGGCRSIRGFEQDTCGPLLNGDPTGGNALFIYNLETRFSVYGNVGGVVFFDFGNVFRKTRNLGTFEKMRETAGLGIRYKTPIGPLSLDWGYKLDRRPGESPYEFCFSVGQAF